MQLLATKFNQIALAIDTTNAQIAALQAKLSELQEHQQQLLSVEQACQSALAQVRTTLSMLNHVDPSEINTFKVAVDAQFGTDAIAFLESAAPATPVEPEPIEPIAPEPTATDGDAAIDVEATTSESHAPATDEQNSTPVTDADDIEARLNKMSIQNIRKLAAAKKVSTSGTRAVIAGRLKVIVTKADLLAAS
jgi:predicted phage tail protein